jgi:hypothetical protein
MLHSLELAVGPEVCNDPKSSSKHGHIVNQQTTWPDALKGPNFQTVNRISNIHGQVNACQSGVSLHIKYRNC